jgi:UDPglucose 6-dehydrogenase
VGIGYLGLSNALLAAQNHPVVAANVNPERIDMVNSRRSPIVDGELEGAGLAILAPPADNDPNTHFIDISPVEAAAADLEAFKRETEVIVANRLPPEIDDIAGNVFARHLFGEG